MYYLDTYRYKCIAPDVLQTLSDRNTQNAGPSDWKVMWASSAIQFVQDCVTCYFVKIAIFIFC